MKEIKDFVIGMVHCLPLPGTVGFKDNCDEIIERAVQDAITLEKGGVDAIMIENMLDDPLGLTLDIEQSVALSAITSRIREAVSLPIGIDAAFCDYKSSVSIAKFNGCQFVRIPVFVDMVQFHGGLITPCARDCVLYRKHLMAEDILIFADIQVKHTNMLIPVPIEQSAKNAQACGADAIIVTGSTTGEATPTELIERAARVVSIPVLAGSGVNAGNIKSQFRVASGCIVGSSLKGNGKLENPILLDKTIELMKAINKG